MAIPRQRGSEAIAGKKEEDSRAHATAMNGPIMATMLFFQKVFERIEEGCIHR